MRIYQFVLRRVLTRIDPETTHHLVMKSLRVLAPFPVRLALRRLFFPSDPRICTRAMGREFPTPLGLAAGFDKDGKYFRQLMMLGFGHIEVGTITPYPQSGNARPRIERVPEAGALRNWMRFPNDGADAVAPRFAGKDAAGDLVGANIGLGERTLPEAAATDYRAAAARFSGLADYLVINVSSPNTKGLRGLQQRAHLEEIISATRAAAGDGTGAPILIKISPDLSDHEIDEVADLAITLELAGIIAVNTRVVRLPQKYPDAPSTGGLSGPPLKERSLEVLERLYHRTQGQVTLVSVGGVESAQDVFDRVLAGANLVQAYTAFIYGGPLWPYRVNRDLGRLVEAAGVQSIEELVGRGRASAADKSTGAASARLSTESVLTV
ncbi:MAG: quinone-dependent dihydroorotate dehydrogenase [Solirubrobacterales bacterium]